MRCSIVILNWNGVEHLRRFLPGVVQNCPVDCEVVVADNGSTDASLACLEREFPAVRRIVLEENFGFAEGYNRAMKEVESPLVLLLNSDVEVRADFLSPMLRYMDEHPDVAAVQPKILAQYDLENIHSPEGMLFEHAGAAGGFMDRLGYPYCRGRLLGELERDKGQYDESIDCFWASGACLLTRTEIYRKAGGLDAAFFAHMEEIDYCWRLHRAGYRVVCLPESEVYHLGGGALPYESPRKVFLNFRNCLLMLRKNLPAKELLWLMPMRCVLDYVAAVQYLLKGMPQAAWAVLQARCAYHKMKRDVVAAAATHALNAVGNDTTRRMPFSVLIRFYLLRQRHFCQLK